MQYAITFCFIVLDFCTGIVKAFSSSAFSSTRMREGLFHKIGLFLCMALGYLIDYAQGFMELSISIPVAAAICSYIVMMEIASTIENLCQINPEIMPEQLTRLFGTAKESDSK